MARGNVQPRTDRPHHPRTAAQIAVRMVPMAVADEPLANVRQRLENERFECVDLVLVVDDSGRYLGSADIRDVLTADPTTPARMHIREHWPAVRPETRQEHAAEAAARAQASCLPVVSKDRRPMGCIPPQKLLHVLGREHREDVHRLVGILREREGAQHALEDRPVQRAMRRLPWLVIGLLLSSGGAALMAHFEAVLTGNIVLAFFIPSLVYLADAIGTQTEAIAVRALSMAEPRPILSILAGETATGALIGTVLGALSFLIVAAVYKDVGLAAGIGLSMTVAGTLASAIGLILPWMLARAGIDPAFGSGPVATIVQDTLTILVYFLIMTWLLTG